jgi:hypothetical protein
MPNTRRPRQPNCESILVSKPPQRYWPKSATRRCALLSDGAAVLFTFERVVSVDLAGQSRPARGEIFQNLGFSFTLR